MFSCPLPITDNEKITLAHGSGGELTNELIEKLFRPIFKNDLLDQSHDGAVFNVTDRKVAFTTDSFVITPIFFNGGDIGSLAINGTVNDLAMCGAKPLFLSCGLILEESFLIRDLAKIVTSMQNSAEIAGVQIITGDTKVVDRGKADQIFINTTGIGIVEKDLRPQNVRIGDQIIVNKTIAEHGISILSIRENIQFETEIKSDTTPLNLIVSKLLKTDAEIRCLRDATRGGVASVLNEISQTANVGIEIDETEIPISDEIFGACEILGLDPLHIANEGVMIAFVSPDSVPLAIETMQKEPQGKHATVIGQVVADHPKLVIQRSKIGGKRIIDLLHGEQLPRIC